MFTLTSKDNTGIFRFILTMSFNEYFLKHSGGGGFFWNFNCQYFFCWFYIWRTSPSLSTSSWSCWFSAQWTPLPTISPCRIARVIEIIFSCWSNSSHRLQYRMQNIVVKSIPYYGILLNELTCSEVLNILTPHSDTKFILQLKEDLIFKMNNVN